MKNADRLGKTLAGKYTIERLIGSGGMGVVYAACHERTSERVAVKFLREEDLHDAELKRRFIQEAKAASDLQHPNVVRLIELDEDRELGMYMMLELLSGETLQELLEREGRIALEPLCEVLFPILHAAALAHDRGIVHRDLKPANIFLHRTATDQIVPKLLDFGIARVVQAKSAHLTRTGEILGSPEYMSPEQAYGDKQLGPTTDVWSMGAVLYRALTGVGPFARANVEATMLDVASATYEPLDARCPELPDASALQAVIGGALTREVARRTPSMRALMHGLAGVAGVEAQAILSRHIASDRISSPIAVAPEQRARRAPTPGPTELLPRRARTRRLPVIALLLLAALCAAGAAIAAFLD